MLTDNQAKLVQAVADGELDCAFVNTAFSHPRLVSAYSFPEKLAFVAPHSIDPGQLSRQTLIATNIPGCPYRRLLEDWSIRTSSCPPRVIEFDTLEGILKAVSLGMGISLLPTSVLEGVQDLQFFPSTEMGETHIHLVVPKGMGNEALSAFIQTVTAHTDKPKE
ncbi:HTH-type transcriptional regulator GltR [compost metagenome]